MIVSRESISMCLRKKWTLSLVGLYCFILFFHNVKCSKNDWYSSVTELHTLVKAEQQILQGVQEYISSLEDRLLLAKAYLKDQEVREDNVDPHLQNPGVAKVMTNDNSFRKPLSENRDSLNWEKITESVSSHPLRTFRLIRRFVTNLPQLEKYARKDDERKFLKVVEKMKKSFSLPNESDLETATQGLLRVQDAYNFDINEFTIGRFEELDTNSSLNAADCYFIGVYSLQAQIYTRAIEWLQRAYILNKEEGDTSITFQKARDQLEDAILQSPYLYRNPVEKVSVLQGPVKKRSRMLDKQTHELYHKKSSFMDLINFAELCRGGRLQKADVIKSLNCYYAMQSPENMLAPLKVEVLHKNPSVLQIHNILSDALIDDILLHAKPSLTRSRVHQQAMEGKKTISMSRTSTSTWIRNLDILRKLSTVYRKVQSLMSLNMEEKDACEDFQVTNYAITGHYNPHQDNILSSEFAPGMSMEEFKKGDRIATLMFYLSNVVKGGWTAFPRLGVVTKPVKGSAVFWFNMKTNGEPEPLSLHGGCPVVYGNKWIANQWIRSNSQMFARKCSKTLHD